MAAVSGTTQIRRTPCAGEVDMPYHQATSPIDCLYGIEIDFIEHVSEPWYS